MLSCSIRQGEILKYYVLLTVHLDISIQRKTNLIHNSSSVYFVKDLYIFRPIIRRYTVCIQILVFIVLFTYLSVVVVGLQPKLKEMSDHGITFNQFGFC